MMDATNMSEWTKEYLALCSDLHNTKAAIKQLSGGICSGARCNEDVEDLRQYMAELQCHKTTLEAKLKTKLKLAKNKRLGW